MALSAVVINPYVFDFKLYDEWMHPLGLYMLIDALLANGIDVRYFDCLERSTYVPVKKYATGTFVFREIPKPDVFGTIKRKYKCYGCAPDRLKTFFDEQPYPDIVLVGSMMTYWADGVVETVRLVREVLPDVPLVVGGLAVRLLPRFFRKALPDAALFDGVLTYGAEVALPGFSRPLHIPATPSLLPGFSLSAQKIHGPALLSLGCPMNCSYCASKFLQPRYHRRSLSVVIEEVGTMVEKFGIRDIAFYDDALLADAAALLVPFLSSVASRWNGVRFHTPNGLHLRYLTGPLLSLMREAGFTTLRFGYETGNQKHRRETGGKADENLLREKLLLLGRIPFKDTGVYVMGGLPQSNPAEMMREMRLVASYGVAVKPVFLSPVPGTPLFNHYAGIFPRLNTDPLWQNDSFFVTMLQGWGAAAVEEVRFCAKELNAALHN